MAKNELAAFGGKITTADRVNDAGKGSENVSSDHLSTPNIKLLQLITPEVKKHDSSYIEGAEPGMFLNTATKALYTSMYVMNLHFESRFNIWDADDNLVEVLDTEQEAKDYLIAEGLDSTKNKIVETHTHTVLILDEKGEPQGAANIYLSRSKIKVSKNWNSMINEFEKKGKARFAYIWQLVPVLESNKKGQEYFNMSPKIFKNAEGVPVEAPDALYNAAKVEIDALYGAVDEAA